MSQLQRENVGMDGLEQTVGEIVRLRAVVTA